MKKGDRVCLTEISRLHFPEIGEAEGVVETVVLGQGVVVRWSGRRHPWTIHEGHLMPIRTPRLADRTAVARETTEHETS
jgi:hypothetical protein